MTQKEFDELRASVQEEHRRELEALDTLRKFVIVDAPHSRSGTNPPKPPKTTADIPDREDSTPGKLCENACGRKLRSDSKTCETCGKKLCSYCRPICAECKKVE